MKVSFHPQARVEFHHTVEYYEERQPGLGLDFADEVYSALQRIVSFPEAWPTLVEDIRRALIHRFPYGVLYAVESDEIYVIAVMNLNRKPNFWKHRLDE